MRGSVEVYQRRSDREGDRLGVKDDRARWARRSDAKAKLLGVEAPRACQVSDLQRDGVGALHRGYQIISSRTPPSVSGC